MSIDEGTWFRRLAPEAQAELIRQSAADRAMGALRHRAGCSCDACRVRQAMFRRYLPRAVAA